MIVRSAQLQITYDNSASAYVNDVLISESSPATVDFIFGTVQILRLGELPPVSLCSLVCSPTSIDGVTVTQVGSLSSTVCISARGLTLTRIEMFGRADPKLKVITQTGDIVYTSEPQPKTRDPIWKPFTILVDSLCNGDLMSLITLQIWDHNEGAPDALMGELTTTLSSLLRNSSDGNAETTTYELINSERPGTRRGDLQVDVELKEGASFFQWVSDGNTISCGVSVDFTASNGNPAAPRSLHYASPDNQYVQCLSKFVNSVLPFSNAEQRIFANGFGAKVEGNKVNHCFPLEESSQSYVSSLDSLLESYRRTCATVSLYGPTIFSDILYDVEKAVNSSTTDDSGCDKPFHVHVILTDGDVHDVVPTLNLLQVLQQYPLLIIIAGVYTRPVLEVVAEQPQGQQQQDQETHHYPKLDLIDSSCSNVVFVPSYELEEALAVIPRHILSFYSDQ